MKDGSRVIYSINSVGTIFLVPMPNEVVCCPSDLLSQHTILINFLAFFSYQSYRVKKHESKLCFLCISRI